MNVDYLPAFITEEEVAILSHPPHAARRTPEHINRLMGYDVFGMIIIWPCFVVVLDHALGHGELG